MLKTVRDESGNKLILEVITEGKRLTLINIYGPNRDDPDFYEEITNNVKYSGNPTVMAGDFNMVLDPDMNCKDYININNPRAGEQVLIDCLFEIRKIAVCFLWLSLPGDYRVTDEALLAETT